MRLWGISLKRPLSLILEDKIPRNNNKYEYTSLREPAGLQKESEKVYIF
jgi:hypothetical protein